MTEYAVNDNNLIIASVTVNGNKLTGSVDLYPVGESYLIAIEPLFEILMLKYELDYANLVVWKKQSKHTYLFKETSNKSGQRYWANDGYYQFIDLSVLNDLFEMKSVFKQSLLSFEITTQNFHFPVTVLKEQKLGRYSDKLYTLPSASSQTLPQKSITIPDEYQLYTMPHGQISGSLNYNDNNESNNVSANIVSDFLYHSMNLNVSKANGKGLVGGIRLSKYKNSPNDRLLGVFDSYSVGDVSGFSNELVNRVGSGVGIALSKSPDNYRRTNNEITIEEQGPPGWDVELYHNKRYVDSQVVPQTGLIVFNDIIVEWGANEYELRLYGPFGEKEVITKNYQLDSNPLAGGDSAYGIYLLDPNNSIFNNSDSESKIELDNFGTSFDYGITDTWQIGLGFNQLSSSLSSASHEQIFSLKNYLNLPGMLIESNLALNSNDGYAQITSITGNLASTGVYKVSYTSAEDFTSGRIASPEGGLEQWEARYSHRIGFIPISFNYRYSDDQTINAQVITNTLSYNFEDFRLSNNLSYSETQFKKTGGDKSSNIIGAMNLSTTIFDSIRITGSLNYRPEEDEFISDTSSINAQWTYQSKSNIVQNLNFRYLPIIDSKNRWLANYSAAWVNDIYRLSLSARYAENDTWSVSMNFNFFLGYDYHNNRALVSSNVNSHSATLNIDTYLDRQLNGIRDPLDYPIEGAKFVGSNNWSNITSGENGYTVLPGVPVRTPFQFRAKWRNGGETINNDYVVYTHPGASINVNMPFYLESELSGFVYTQADKADFAANGIELQLRDKNNTLVKSVKTDSDGYYEFLKMEPNQYTLQVSETSLKGKQLSANVIGYKIKTSAKGGYIELPDLLLSKNTATKLKNEILTLDIDDLNEPLIWNEDEQQQKNYFLMPLKNKEISAPHQVPKLANSAPKRTLSKEKIPYSIIDQLGDEKVNNADVKSIENNISATKVDKELYVIQLAAFVDKSAGEAFIKNYKVGNVKPILATISNSYASYKFIYKAILSTHETKSKAEKYVLENEINYQDYLIVKVKESDLELSSEQLTDLEAVSTEPPIKNAENISNKSGWFIQYFAGKLKVDKNILNKFTSVPELHQSQKIISSTGDTYYCLLSAPFNTKKEALEVNENSLIKGWVLPATAFKEITKVEK